MRKAGSSWPAGCARGRVGPVPHLILISTHEEAEYADLIEASSAIGFLAKTDLSATRIRQMLAAIDGDKADES